MNSRCVDRAWLLQLLSDVQVALQRLGLEGAGVSQPLAGGGGDVVFVGREFDGRQVGLGRLGPVKAIGWVCGWVAWTVGRGEKLVCQAVKVRVGIGMGW